MLVQKTGKKGRTRAEADTVIFWLTGYDAGSLAAQLDRAAGVETLFAEAPAMNPDASLITGVICGHRVEEIEDPRDAPNPPARQAV